MDYNFYDFKFDNFTINQPEFEKFKSLQTVLNPNGGYYSPMLQWRPDSTLDPERCKVYISMISKSLKTKEDIAKYYDGKVWNYQLSLLRYCYFDVDEVNIRQQSEVLEFEDYSDRNPEDYKDCLVLAYKRPFGNSWVEGDVFGAVLHDTEFIKSLPKEKQDIIQNMDVAELSLMCPGALIIVEDDTHASVEDFMEGDMFLYILNSFYDVLLGVLENFEFEYNNFDVECSSWNKKVDYSLITNDTIIVNHTHFMPPKSVIRHKKIKSIVD